MARPGRREVPNGTYYVVDQFRRDRDTLVHTLNRPYSAAELRQLGDNRREYERLLTNAVNRTRARIHAHCFLPHSAQLLIQVRQVPLLSVMQTLRGSFSRYLKRHAGFEGTVHPERYRALLVDPEDDFFLDVARNIVSSPVQAKLTKRAQDYAYSSLPALIGSPPPPFLDSTLADELAIRGATTPEKILKVLSATSTPGFAIRLARRKPLAGPLFLAGLRSKTIPAVSPVSVDEILTWIIAHCGVETPNLVSHAHSQEAAETQALAAWLATASGIASLSSMATRLHCSKSTLHRHIARLHTERPDLVNEITLTKFAAFLASL